MKTYLWNNAWAANKAFGGYACYQGKTEKDLDQCAWIERLIDHAGHALEYPTLANWQPPTLVKEEKGKLGDCALAFSCAPIISQKAKDLLEDIWVKDAILYPVNLEPRVQEPYYLVVPQHSLDCIDQDQTEYGLWGLTIERLVVCPEKIGKADLFSIMMFSEHTKQWLHAGYYVSEHFKQSVIATSLEGFFLIDAENPRKFSDYFISKSAQTLKKEQEDKNLIQQHQLQITHERMLEKGIENRDLSALLQSYESILQQLLTKPQFKKITQINYDLFIQKFSKALDKALVSSHKTPAIKAIYFEYHENESTLFLCQSFDQNDTDAQWAADIAPGKSSVIHVGSVSKLFPELQKIPLPEITYLIQDYLHLKLLSACLEKSPLNTGMDYPFGFANHDDGQTICILPK